VKFALPLIVVGGLALRLFALFGAGGPVAAPIDHDPGVYFAASAMLVRGVLPYRDFVFVHPPGALYVFAPLAVFRIDLAFIAARFLAAIVGAVNIYLVGRMGGLVGALLYAVYPDAIIAERAPYLEPVLNLACLSSAFFWRKDRSILAGVLAGAACSIKLIGGVWVIAAMASGGRRLRFLGAAAATGALLLAPLALTAPRNFILETLLFHSRRPVDGIVGAAARLHEMFNGGHLAVSILAIVGLFSLKKTRYFAVASVLTIGVFLASASFWGQYDAHLAASTCVLAGMAIPPRRQLLAAILVLPLAVMSFPKVGRSPEVVQAGDAIRKYVPPNDCVVTFEPAWSMIGGRLPVIVDSYAVQLLAAGRAPDTDSAFKSPASQREVRARLEGCRFAVLGWRGKWQLNDQSREWFGTHYSCRAPVPGSLSLWERSDKEVVYFAEGWYEPEGTPENIWRWMGARSLTILPADTQHLDLSFYVPLDALPAPPTITVEVDGRVIDRISATTSEIARSYDVAGKILVLTTDKVVNPARAGKSGDDRDLGVRVNRLAAR